MSVSVARKAALEVLTRVRERSAYAHETLDAVLSSRSLEPRDRALTTRLSYGAIATRGTLDEAVLRVASPGTHLDPKVADALALAAYEMLFTDTPHRAVVNEAVELVRSVDKRAAGLANALMRKLTQQAPSFPWGDPKTDIEALARLHGHPVWLARLWVDQLGFEAAEKVMAANNLPAPMYASYLPVGKSVQQVYEQLQADGASPSPAPLANTWLLDAPAAARRSKAIAERHALVIDEAAHFAASAIRPAAGQNVVELGAGRGTKSLLLAGLARKSGGAATITSVDLHEFKLQVLAQAAKNLGFDEISTLHADATDLDSMGLPLGSADSVLVDAPCSGLGTLRRHPDRRWRARPEEIESLAVLGRRMLGVASRLVKPGGFVVYSTCTIARRENEDVIEGFLASESGSGFDVDSLSGDVPREWDSYVSQRGLFQSLPSPDGPDGHFVARLVRRT